MAIAVDTSGTQGSNNAGSATITYAFNNSAGDILVVGVFNVAADGTPTATYDGTSMTEIDNINFTATRKTTLLYQTSPSTGSNNVVVTQTGSTFLYSTAASYTGAETTQPDSSATNSASSSTTLTVSTTVVASDCWLVGVTSGDNGNNPGAGSGATLRSTIGADRFIGILDTNGTVSTGSQDLNSTMPVSQNIGGVVFSMEPAAAATFIPKVIGPY